MPKAIVVAVGDTPLNPLNDLLKQNSISSKVIDATTSSVDEIDKLIQADDQGQCVLLKGISSLSQHIPRIADATEKLVLLYCSPATALANALETSNGTVKPEQVINRWQESVSQAMAMVEESELYSLCDLNDVLEHSSLFLKDFFAINKAAAFKPSTYTKKQLANHLATLYLFEQDDAFALYDEVLSIGKLFGEFTVHLGPDTDEIKQSAAESGQSVFKQLISNNQEIQSKHNEIESLKAQSSEKVNALEKQIAELQHTKAAFEENSIQLQEELTKNKELAEQQASKIEALQDSKQNIETKLQAVTAQIEKSQNEITALASELSDKEASLTENQERLTNIQSQLQGKEQRNTQLQSQIEELKASSAKLNEELRHQKQVIAESDKDKAAKSAALKELENKLQSVNQQVSELNSEKIELTNTVQQLNEQLVNQHSVNKEKEQECKATKSSLQETQQQLQAAKTNVTELKAQQDELTSTIEELKQQQANQQSIIEEKEKECKATKSSLQETQQQLQAANTNVTELKAQQGELTSTIGELKQQLANQQSVIEDKDKEYKATKKSLQETQQQLQAAKTNVTELKAQQDELTSTIEGLKQQRANQQSVIEENEQTLKNNEATLRDTQHNIKAATQYIDELQEQKEDLEEKLQLISKENQSLTQKANLQASTLNAKTANIKSLTEELAESAQALQNEKKKISLLESEKTAVQEELEITTLQAAQLQKELEAVYAELHNLQSTIPKFEQDSKKLKTAIQKLENINSQKELMELQLCQLQEELETSHSQYDTLKIIAQNFEQQNQRFDTTTKQFNELTVEKDLADLQIAQLQEELETILTGYNNLKITTKKFGQQSEELRAAYLQLEKAGQVKQLTDLQLEQLQEELEVVSKQKDELARSAERSNSEVLAKTLEVEQLLNAKEELTARCTSLKQQVEVAITGHSKQTQELIADLQKQLEQQLVHAQNLNSENAELKEQLSNLNVVKIENKQFQQAELELASLQISQLQEELEYYYAAWQEAHKRGPLVTNMAKYHQKVFNKAMAESISVTGKYAEDGYQDVHILLTNVQLADGRKFQELPVKLVEAGEHIAIEFRDDSNGKLFHHYEDSTDEYGPYLRYFATSSEDNAEQQKLAYTRMNASERILVMSTVSLLAELIQAQNIPSDVLLNNEEWRRWRLSAIRLAEAIEELPNWLSFDSVTLKEEYRTDGYEHLWLAFNNVLVGDSWKEHMELKVAATGINDGEGAAFCEDISLEFRELEDGTPPLLTWPPESEDDFGPVFVVSIRQLTALESVAALDKTLITHLANNLSSIVEKTEVQHAGMSRAKTDWKSAISALLEGDSERFHEKESEEQFALAFEEVVSMGSYQHVLFVDVNHDTKIKLKAQNINADTFDAEIFVELRDGTSNVIYHDSAFYGEDEYGPRVLIPAESLFGEIIPTQQEEFNWLINTFAQLAKEIEINSDMDELVKRLWANMLKRKQEIL